VSASAERGMMEDSEQEMLHAVFDFRDTLVRQVMVPRTEVVAVPAEAGLEQILQVATAHGYSKMPVYQDDLDHVLGVVHLMDIVSAQRKPGHESLTARQVMRETVFVPEVARVSTLLQVFRARQRHLAIALDEYGGTAGMVTLEDLLEEVFGEVSDPFDRGSAIQPQPDGSSLVDGLTRIEEINEHFGLELQDPHYDTIAGFMLGRLGRLAMVGDTVTTDGVRLTVDSMDGKRVARVWIFPRAGPS
jgi:CBS domain containing-hemolysin-like protein